MTLKAHYGSNPKTYIETINVVEARAKLTPDDFSRFIENKADEIRQRHTSRDRLEVTLWHCGDLIQTVKQW